jgi:hypothetical protein
VPHHDLGRHGDAREVAALEVGDVERACILEAVQM